MMTYCYWLMGGLAVAGVLSVSLLIWAMIKGCVRTTW